MRYCLPTLVLAASLLAPAVGCRPEDEIVHYRAPKSAPPVAVSPPAQPQPQLMQPKSEGMLAAIVPHDRQAWFFKLTGPVEAIVAQGEVFRKFVQSVHFAGDTPSYDAPADWRAQGPSDLRHETFVIPAPKSPGGKPIELAITRLAKPEGDYDGYLLANLNRWRGQMGLEPIDISRLAESTSHVRLADGTDATLVAMAGKGQPAAKPAEGAERPKSTPRDAGAQAEPGAAPDGMLAAIVPQGEQAWFFKLSGPADAVASQRDAFAKFIESVRFEASEPRYAPPADWQAQGPSVMRYETFRLPAAGRALELAVSTLVKPPGDAEDYLLANVNRWRDQLGLAPIEKAQMAGETASVKLAGGRAATVVDLVGKLKAGGAPPFAPGK